MNRTPAESIQPDAPTSSRTPLPSSSLPSPTSNTPEPRDEWRIKSSQSGYKCQIVIAAPPPVQEETLPKGSKEKPKAPAEPDHLIRANSLAGYWELNRRFIRSLAASQTGPNVKERGEKDKGKTESSQPHSPAQPITQPEETGPIHSSAGVSPDSLIGQGSRVGEKASIKKCIIGRHCVIGKGAKLTGCVLWDFVVVEEK
jgi:translation initiation factor eIF-2B subunit gamma